MKTGLLIIDPQNDFCDPKGSLYVAGAEMDMIRLGAFISKNFMNLNDIQVTLDSHHRIHVAHGISWLDQKNQSPAPFTIITAQDVRDGKYRARNPQFQSRYLSYVEALEKNNRYILCIWPEHCLIGTPGAAIFKDVWEGIYAWEGRYAIAGKVTKGSNLFTEHYSAVKADVEDHADPLTKMNMDLVNILQDNDEILISGEALSHCLASTVQDIANVFSDADIKKLVLLEDTCSSVTGFENLGTAFINNMVNRGMRVTTTQSYKFQ